MKEDLTLRFSSVAELDSAIQKLADAAGSTAREVLPAQMRLLAVDLAFNTRPIGKNKASQKDGKDKVEKRVLWVYPSVGMMVELLKRKEERLGIAFSVRVKKRQYSEAARILNNVFASNFTVGEFDGGALHRSQQFSAKVSRRLVVVNYPKVKQYLAAKKKLVGFAKGGFAAAARQLGGVRGIPGFASRQPAPGSGSVKGDGKTLVVTMVNGVKYIEDALDAHGEARALANRERAVTLVIKRMMDRKTKRASTSIK